MCVLQSSLVFAAQSRPFLPKFEKEIDPVCRFVLHEGLSAALDQVGVKTAAETPIGGEQYNVDFLTSSRAPAAGSPLRRPLRQAPQNFGEFAGIGPKGFHLGLGTAQPRGRHHVHRLGDLFGLLDRGNF
jgi:hypothetical protein